LENESLNIAALWCEMLCAQCRRESVLEPFPRQLKDMMLQAAERAGGEGGTIAYLDQQAKANPIAFLGLLGKVLPTQHSGEDSGPIVHYVMSERPMTEEEWERDRCGEQSTKAMSGLTKK
jgi:hypothetical protein